MIHINFFNLADIQIQTYFKQIMEVDFIKRLNKKF